MIWPTLGVALVAAAVAFGATPVAGRLAGILKMYDAPSERKLHAAVIPYLGGLGIMAGWFVAFLTPGTLGQSVVLMGCMLLLGVLGFVDDRRDLNPHLRLVLQIVIAVAAYAGGLRMTAFDNSVVELCLTTLWLVGITNAFNFMDNMDGLAAGVGGIGALSLGIIGVFFGQHLVSVLGFSLAGACLGFLRHNFHPARIFMGDTGSLPLGFGLAALAIKVQFPGVPAGIAFAVPVIALGLFVVDTTVMALGRVLRKEPVVGARLDHLSHRLLQRDLPVPDVALRLYLIAAALGIFAIVISVAPATIAALLVVGVAFSSCAGIAMALKWPPMAAPSSAPLTAK